MRNLKSGIAALLVAVALAGSVNAAEVDEAVRAKLAPIVKALGADDFSVREKAQKDLVELGADYLPAMAEAVEKTKVEEVKAGLQLAMATITEQVALNPPAISIAVENATGTDIGAALSKATGKTLEPMSARTGEVEAKGVTLKLEKKPYWEVVGALNAKWPIDVSDTQYDRKYLLNVSDAPKDVYKRAFVQGGIAFIPLKFTKTSDDGGILSLRVAVDPRIRILKQSGPTFTEILDQAGKPLEPRLGNQTMSIARGWVTTYSPSVKFPDRPPTGISSIKGEMKFLVLVEAETMEVADLSKVVNKPLELGGYKITFSKAEILKGTPEIMFSTEGRQNKADPGEVRLESIDAEFEVTDGNGKYISTVQVSGGGGGMRWGRNAAFVEPLKGRFVAPKRVKEVTIPFTLKDLPIE